MRFSKPAAYAVKALALLNMQKYDEAEEVAKQAIDINGTINNYNTSYLGSTQGYITGGTYPVINRGKKGTDEDYFLMEILNPSMLTPQLPWQTLKLDMPIRTR